MLYRLVGGGVWDPVGLLGVQWRWEERKLIRVVFCEFPLLFWSLVIHWEGRGASQDSATAFLEAIPPSPWLAWASWEWGLVGKL